MGEGIAHRGSGGAAVESVVRTVPGRVRGSRSGGVHSFRGISYAAPPFGPNRLRPPRRVTPWSGVRDALAFGAEPPQLRPPADHPAAALIWDPALPGEDCLNLNVWTPDLPVLVSAMERDWQALAASAGPGRPR